MWTGLLFEHEPPISLATHDRKQITRLAAGCRGTGSELAPAAARDAQPGQTQAEERKTSRFWYT